MALVFRARAFPRPTHCEVRLSISCDAPPVPSSQHLHRGAAFSPRRSPPLLHSARRLKNGCHHLCHGRARHPPSLPFPHAVMSPATAPLPRGAAARLRARYSTVRFALASPLEEWRQLDCWGGDHSTSFKRSHPVGVRKPCGPRGPGGRLPSPPTASGLERGDRTGADGVTPRGARRKW